jgi:hypothetical protein
VNSVSVLDDSDDDRWLNAIDAVSEKSISVVEANVDKKVYVKYLMLLTQVYLEIFLVVVCSLASYFSVVCFHNNFIEKYFCPYSKRNIYLQINPIFKNDLSNFANIKICLPLNVFR